VKVGDAGGARPYGRSVLCSSDWPAVAPIDTTRLALEPLRVSHADEMVSLLGDGGLYAFTGGEPFSLDALRARYARQAAGRSPDGSRGWLNWIVRARWNRTALGTVQATLSIEDRRLQAELAWVIGISSQRQGYATEAAQAVLDWLGRHGVAVFVAHIHSGHAASAGVARHLSLTPTGVVVDGEIRWVSDRL